LIHCAGFHPRDHGIQIPMLGAEFMQAAEQGVSVSDHRGARFENS